MPGDTTHPKVSKEPVLIKATIDAHEGSSIRICDIPGDFLSADMDEDVKMAWRGRLTELMVNIANQIYRQHVKYEKGRPVLYITIKKALYSCQRSSFMFYERLVVDMRGMEF